METLLTSEDVEVCTTNCMSYDKDFRSCRKRCAQCRFPLSSRETHNILAEIGEVCQLCHAMHWAVKNQPGLQAAHDEYVKDQARKKKIVNKEKEK